jgi:hypothetical protein
MHLRNVSTPSASENPSPRNGHAGNARRERALNRPLKLGLVLVAIVACAWVSQTLLASTVPDYSVVAIDAASICVGAPWSPRVSFTKSALHELRERMARYSYPTGIWIMGPLEEDCRAPESIEEAWLIEKLYGPPQRWVLDIVRLEELVAPEVDPPEMFCVGRVCGITVGILSSKTVSRLSVELHGDALRVVEVDG